MTKCQGRSGESYPGLAFQSSIKTAGRKACLVGNEPASQQIITVSNSSLLTYEIQFRSTCDKEHLRYLNEGSEADENSVWEGSFTAPFRWDRSPRTSSDAADLIARPGKSPAIDREIDVTISCKTGWYSPVGPFRVLLQVDTDPR
jgi:hypothetical protein